MESCESDGIEGFGEGADLIEFDQDGVCGTLGDALLKASGVGDKEVVTDELDVIAEGIGEGFESVPIVFSEGIFDGDDRVALAEVDVIGDSFGGVDLFLIEVVFAIFEERACGGIECEADIFSGLVSGIFDGLEDEFQGFFVVGEVGSEAAFVADVGIEFAAFENFFEGMKDLGGGAKGFAEGGCADGHDHKLLDIESIVGVFATVNDVAHGCGECGGVDTADVAVEWEFESIGGSARGSHRDAEDGVGSEAGLVGGSVEVEHEVVDLALLEGVFSAQVGCDLFADVLNGFEDAFSEVAFGVFVAEFEGFMDAGGCAAWDGSTAKRAILEEDIDFDGWISTGIKDLTGKDILDLHGESPMGNGRGWIRDIGRFANRPYMGRSVLHFSRG